MRFSTLNLGFWGLWLLAVLLCYVDSYDDPSSLFYRQDRAFEPRYSRVRAAEADEFLAHLDHPSTSSPPDMAREAGGFLCVGIPSINRTTKGFLKHTIATLIDTITSDERSKIHIIVLLADRSPQDHYAYGKDWLEKTVDEVLVYEQHERPQYDPHSAPRSPYRAVPLNVYDGQPRGTGRVENMRLDHSVLTEACRKWGSDHFALVEDDIVASRDWFQRLETGLKHVEKQSTESGTRWIYLRLFYSEIFMGWNREEWLLYSEAIIIVYSVVLLAFLVLRIRLRKYFTGTRTNKFVDVATSNWTGAMVFSIWLPAMILLYFMAGRVAVGRWNPLQTWGSAGVIEMPRYGCCAQGLVFPKDQLEGLQRLLREPPYDFAGDQLLEGYAGHHQWTKWALKPSVLQHVGLVESSAGPQRAEVWNFSFERQHRK